MKIATLKLYNFYLLNERKIYTNTRILVKNNKNPHNEKLKNKSRWGETLLEDIVNHI